MDMIMMIPAEGGWAQTNVNEAQDLREKKAY
jgi:hypothetical protein